MNTQISKVKATSIAENEFVIGKVMSKIAGITRIEEAYSEIEKIINPTLWKCGRGGNHIWVSNWADERLMLILETRLIK